MSSQKRNYLAAGDAPPFEAIVENVRALCAAADARTIADGASWYPSAYQGSELIARATGFSVSQIAAVMALSSPATGWGYNGSVPMQIALYVRDGGRERPGFFTGGDPSWQKILRVLVENDLTAVNTPKVGVFYAAIMGDAQAVTIDRHMLRIGYGGGMFETAADSYKKNVARAVAIVADEFGWTPRDCQAIAWTHYRRVTVTRGGRTIEEVYG